MGIGTDKVIAGTKRAGRGVGAGGVIILIAAFLVSWVVGVVVYVRVNAASTPAQTYQTATVTRGTIAATVSTTGSVMANRKSQLSFGTSGTIAQVNVSLGDKVKSGQVLAKLDTASLENKVAQAKSAVKAAQIKLDQLKTPATPNQIAAAEAALTSAQAKYDSVAAGAKDADIKAAEQAVVGAQAALTKAQTDLTNLKAGPTQDQITAAKADVDKKQAVLQQAQAAYDKVAWRGDIQSRPESVALQQATADYQAALATYNQKIAPPKPQDLDAAQKSVDSATAALASAQAKLDQLWAGPTDADLRAAQAAVVAAKADLAAKKGDASPTAIAAAQEAINSAQLAEQAAQIDLSKASLTAPFDGIVSGIKLNVGEQVPSMSGVEIVDPSSVRVDVNVDETDVSKLAIGKQAQVTFDALPGTTLNGKVVAISPNATVQQGIVSYEVSLQLDTLGIYLPVGMTANAKIIADQRNNVIVVPNRAIKTQGGKRVADVLVNGKPETRQVAIGLSNDQMTEVANGLSEGDQVVMPTTTAQPRVGVFGGLGGSGGAPQGASLSDQAHELLGIGPGRR